MTVTSAPSKEQPVGEAGPKRRRPGAGLMPSVESPGHFWPSVMNLDEAATFLRVTKQTLLKLARAGDVPGNRVGQAWRFSHDALLGWLADSTEKLPLAGKSRAATTARPTAVSTRDTPGSADETLTSESTAT